MDPDAASHAETAKAWDIVARAKYAAERQAHVELLRSGRHNLLVPEATQLEALLPGSDVVQFQCSYGLDALGLLNAGARSVVGIDISAEMIALATATAKDLGVDKAKFVCADVVQVPAVLHATADLLYTGRGSLPWILDLDAWARSAREVLREGGHVFVFEGHPLNFLWDRGADAPTLRGGASYFDEAARRVDGFPSSVVERETGGDGPRMLERIWRPGQVIAALLRSGFSLLRYEEHPDLFWDQFPRWPQEVRQSLPNSYSLLARAG